MGQSAKGNANKKKARKVVFFKESKSGDEKSADGKLFRLTRILNHLNDAGHVRTSDLAMEFGVRKRTIQRDLEFLNIAGFPLTHDGIQHKFMEGYSLRKIRVSEEEKELLTILCQLFSGVEGPLKTTSKNLLDRFLVVPTKEMEAEDFQKQRNMLLLSLQAEEMSKSIEVACQGQDDLRSPAFEEATRAFVKELEGVVAVLKREGVLVSLSENPDPKRPRLFCTLKVPVDHFAIPEPDLRFNKKETHYAFDFFALYPDTLFKNFRIRADIRMNYSFWGPFIEPKKFICFDKLMARLGFLPEHKHANYEVSYGNEDFLITRVLVSWSKSINLPEGEKTPFRKKKVLVFENGKSKVLKGCTVRSR